MKKLLFSIMMIMAVTLTSCSFAPTSTTATSTSNELSITTLAVGTLKLEGTAQDISAEQAGELIAYWQLYQDLTKSRTAAQEEINATITQIQETMTAEQIQAIKEMQITQQDLASAMQGVTVVSSSSSANTTSTSRSSAGMPAGGPPVDGGIVSELGGAVPVSSTNQSQSAQTASGTTDVPTALIKAVIQSLQRKIAA